MFNSTINIVICAKIHKKTDKNKFNVIFIYKITYVYEEETNYKTH